MSGCQQRRERGSVPQGERMAIFLRVPPGSLAAVTHVPVVLLLTPPFFLAIAGLCRAVRFERRHKIPQPFVRTRPASRHAYPEILRQAGREDLTRSPARREAAYGAPDDDGSRGSEEEGGGSVCGICLEDLPGAGQTSLPCSPVPHVFHTACVEGLCRRSRRLRRRNRRTREVVIDCPFCRQESPVSEIPGFEGVRFFPVPRMVGGFAPEPIDDFCRRNFGRRHAVDVLQQLEEDILGISWPPWAADSRWCEAVEHYRRLPSVMVLDDAHLPVLNRDLRFRERLEAWMVSLERLARRGEPIPELPSPSLSSEEGEGVSVDGAAATEEGSESCGICAEPLSGREVSRLPCHPVFHEFHTSCVDNLCRDGRYGTAASPRVDCPTCSCSVIVRAIPGFESVRAYVSAARLLAAEGARLELAEYMRATWRNRIPTGSNVLTLLSMDILGRRWPPFRVPNGWSSFVHHIRRLPARSNPDNAPNPILNRDEAARAALEAWAIEVHRSNSTAVPPFPWVSSEAEARLRLLVSGPPSPPPSPPPPPPSSPPPLSTQRAIPATVTPATVTPATATPSHAQTGVGTVDPDTVCAVCAEPILVAEDEVRMPCGGGMHVLHTFCAEELIRRRRREGRSVSAVPERGVIVDCVYCRREVDVCDLAVFRGTDPRPVPSRSRAEDDVAGTAWEENQTLEAVVLDDSQRGRSASDDLLVQLCRDIARERWPEFSTPAGWGECVAAFRAALPDHRRYRGSRDHSAVQTYPEAYRVLLEWGERVDGWARRQASGWEDSFPEFPPFEVWTRSGGPLEAWARVRGEGRAGGVADIARRSYFGAQVTVVLRPGWCGLSVVMYRSGLPCLSYIEP